MNFLNWLALAGVLIWTIALIVAHIARLKGDNWLTNTISHYLTGPDGEAVDIGFYALGVGLVALAFTVGTWPAVFYVIGGIGTVGAAITRAVWPNSQWHVRAAGAAFGGIGVADILASLGHSSLLVLAITAPVVAVLTLGERANTAIQEKSVAALYVAWLLIVTIGRLSGHSVI